MADNGKINHKMGMDLLRHFHSHFKLGKDGMDKKRAISIITGAVKLYHENLEDQKVLFVYGNPADVKSEVKLDVESYSSLQFFEAAFHRGNFLHLTGVCINKLTIESAIHFYSKCLDGRLTEEDFFMSKDGSTVQKLDVLKDMMNIKKSASMIGDFTDLGPKLYSERVVGNVFACVGFVYDKLTHTNVPNTLLNKDVRDVSSKTNMKIYAVFSKQYTDDSYSKIEKCDKIIDAAKLPINYQRTEAV